MRLFYVLPLSCGPLLELRLSCVLLLELLLFYGLLLELLLFYGLLLFSVPVFERVLPKAVPSNMGTQSERMLRDSYSSLLNYRVVTLNSVVAIIFLLNSTSTLYIPAISSSGSGISKKKSPFSTS